MTKLRRRPVPVDYETSRGQIFNNGHTIEIETEGNNVLDLDGEEYELLQFHFHGLSEHTFDGKGGDRSSISCIRAPQASIPSSPC